MRKEIINIEISVKVMQNSILVDLENVFLVGVGLVFVDFFNGCFLVMVVWDFFDVVCDVVNWLVLLCVFEEIVDNDMRCIFEL